MRTSTATAFVLACLLVAACGGSDDAGSQATGGDGGATVAVASSELGQVVVDGDGMTLYVFLPDNASTPTCTGSCATTWPPFAGPATAGAGVNGALLATTSHPSGVTMATYDGWPLYHFTGDTEPGDTNGQGVGNSWYVLAPDGTPVMDQATNQDSDTDTDADGSVPADSDYGY